METTIGVRMPDWLVEDVDELADQRISTRSEVVRQAVLAYCMERRGKNGRQPSTGSATGGKRRRRNAGGRK